MVPGSGNGTVTILTPAALGVAPKGLDTYDPDLTAEKIGTNEFINPRIGLKTAKCK